MLVIHPRGRVHLTYVSFHLQILPDEQVRSALSTVFKLNVMLYNGGSCGAVNGMRPDGKVDESSVQSNEVWTGVTYALAATMIHKASGAGGDYVYVAQCDEQFFLISLIMLVIYNVIAYL